MELVVVPGTLPVENRRSGMAFGAADCFWRKQCRFESLVRSLDTLRLAKTPLLLQTPGGIWINSPAFLPFQSGCFFALPRFSWFGSGKNAAIKKLNAKKFAANSLRSLLRYFAALSIGRIVLWCYAIWYAVNLVLRFDPRPRLWITSIGLSVIIGAALWISTASSSKGTMSLDRWQVFRLFLMPFCVSSFAALVKDAGYILIFPPSLFENILGFGAIIVFLLVVLELRRRKRS